MHSSPSVPQWAFQTNTTGFFNSQKNSSKMLTTLLVAIHWKCIFYTNETGDHYLTFFIMWGGRPAGLGGFFLLFFSLWKPFPDLDAASSVLPKCFVPSRFLLTLLFFCLLKTSLSADLISCISTAGSILGSTLVSATSNELEKWSTRRLSGDSLKYLMVIMQILLGLTVSVWLSAVTFMDYFSCENLISAFAVLSISCSC